MWWWFVHTCRPLCHSQNRTELVNRRRCELRETNSSTQLLGGSDVDGYDSARALPDLADELELEPTARMGTVEQGIE